jgi:hypothetical protein
MVYWLGGSACSGKTTVAEDIAARRGFSLFHCDDSLFEHMAAADPLRQPAMAKAASLNRLGWDALFMRPVEEQVADELAFYHEEFPLLVDQLAGHPPEKPLLAEGNAWLPELLRALGVSPARAAYLVPTRGFQWAHYSRREFIQAILAQCPDPQPAFANWMERDARLGEEVCAQAAAWGAPVQRVDGSLGLEETRRWVERAWGLE